MRDREDRELGERFRDLKRVEGEGAPDFRSLFDRALEEASSSGLEIYPGRRTPPQGPRKLLWGGSFLAAAAAAFLLLVPSTSDSEFVQVVQAFSSDPAGGAWASPTDGLLDLPGGEILSTFPTLGTSLWLTGPGADPRRNEL